MRKEIKTLLDSIASQADLSSETTDKIITQAFDTTMTAEERREAGQYLMTAIDKRKRPDVDVKGLMGEMTEALNLSYIAKRYFNKDRAWLYQRLNKTSVNGKPATFTQAEIKRLSDSLSEISNKINQISTQLTH